MTRVRIPRQVRDRVIHAAKSRCGYCLTPTYIIGPLLEIEHIVPLALGGSSDESNLWLACPICNGHKSDRLLVQDPLSATHTLLFNPRTDDWIKHFTWVADGTMIKGLTEIGRATVAALQMNHPDMILARQLWVQVGWHPPSDSVTETE
jgi:hypothetical protein